VKLKPRIELQPAHRLLFIFSSDHFNFSTRARGEQIQESSANTHTHSQKKAPPAESVSVSCRRGCPLSECRVVCRANLRKVTAKSIDACRTVCFIVRRRRHRPGSSRQNSDHDKMHRPRRFENRSLTSILREMALCVSLRDIPFARRGSCELKSAAFYLWHYSRE
jgi:hypothetical protein